MGVSIRGVGQWYRASTIAAGLPVFPADPPCAWIGFSPTSPGRGWKRYGGHPFPGGARRCRNLCCLVRRMSGT